MSVPDTITFVNAPAEVGQVTLRTSEEETRMAFAPAGPDGEPVPVLTTSRARRVRREEVVAVRGAVASRLRVTFIEDATAVETNGEEQRSMGPLAGSTFEVERLDAHAAVLVFEASGAPARYEVGSAVAAQYRDVGRARPVMSELPVGPQKVGDSSPELARGLAAGVSGGAAITRVDAPTATLSEIRRGPDGSLHGLYRIGIQVTGVSSGSIVTMTLMGTLLLRDVDGAALDVRLQGAVKTSPEVDAGDAARPKLPAGAGEFKLTQTIAHTRP